MSEIMSTVVADICVIDNIVINAFHWVSSDVLRPHLNSKGVGSAVSSRVRTLMWTTVRKAACKIEINSPLIMAQLVDRYQNL